MCIQWPHVKFSVVIAHQSNPPISQFSRPCNEFTDCSREDYGATVTVQHVYCMVNNHMAYLVLSAE